MKKRIEYILAGKEKQITREETILQPLPHKDFRFANPFIVIHHLRPEIIAPGSAMRIHPHPHRGFAPVTFQLRGEGYHMDNAGRQEVVRAGDAQWMFAGKGILHSEGPSQEMLRQGGVQEFIQIWVNAPGAHKWDEPFYQKATKEKQPLVWLQEGIDVRLVSGAYEDKIGPLVSFTPVISMVGSIKKGAQAQFMATPGYWTLLYIARGTLDINRETIGAYNLVVFEKANEEVLITSLEDAEVLILSAEPIDEPVAAKDNFVMNTAQEIEQAIQDYSDGLFGRLDH